MTLERTELFMFGKENKMEVTQDIESYVRAVRRADPSTHVKKLSSHVEIPVGGSFDRETLSIIVEFERDEKKSG